MTSFHGPAPDGARLAPAPMPYGVELPCRHRWPVTLRAGAVVLRPLVRRDHAQWSSVRERDWDWLSPWEATRPPTSTEPIPTFARMIARNERRARRHELLPWALAWDEGWPQAPTRRPDRLPLVGQFTVFQISHGSALSCSMGYWVAADRAGQGIVPTALALACDYVFQVMGLHRVEVCVRPENAPSLRVVEKVGMVEEGTRARFLHIDGDWRDHRVFRMMPQDHPRGVLHDYLERHVLPGSPLT